MLSFQELIDISQAVLYPMHGLDLAKHAVYRESNIWLNRVLFGSLMPERRADPRPFELRMR